MLDKIQLWLKSKIGQPYAYYLTVCLYLLLTFGGLAIIGFIFGILWQVLLISILISTVRSYSMGFHANSNIHCFIISSILMIIFGKLSEIMPIWCVFILCMYSCKGIYLKSPVELNLEHESKDEDWHFKRTVLIMVIYLIIALFAYYFKFYQISKCIMLSLVMVDLLLFKNNKPYI